MSNPWKSSGVSLIPADLKDWMPMVGQKSLYTQLVDFKNRALVPDREKMAGFFALVGGWGLGKSRTGHETVLEAVDPDIEWIIDGQGQRVLEPGLKEGILPLFIRYSQVTEGPIRLSTESWMPAAIYQGLDRLLQQAQAGGSDLKRNQDRLYQHLLDLLQPKGFTGIKDELAAALKAAAAHQGQLPKLNQGIHQALQILQRIGIQQLWIVVDEIEDITDVEREGLPDEDRHGVQNELLTVISSVIKQEEIRQEYPEANFLLLCARSVGDMLRDIKALERRTGYHELSNNSFADVQAYFQYLQKQRPTVFQSMEHYPDGLKEAAFFAANRNFGWFNVIMHYCHENHRNGTVSVPELLKMFAIHDSRASRSVFDTDALSDYNIASGPVKENAINYIYGQLPQRIGGSITEEEAEKLLAVRHTGRGQKIFASLVEVLCPDDADLMSNMIQAGFRYDKGNCLALPGEGTFDLQELMECLRSYSIGLAEDSAQHLLLFRDFDEFVEQIRGLTPYEKEASFIAGPLHRFLMQDAYRFREKGEERCYLAPSFGFMLHFNRLNRRARADQGYLKDGALNTKLEEAYHEVQNQAIERQSLLLKGFAQVWEDEVLDGNPDTALQCSNYVFTGRREPLNIGNDSRITLIYPSDNNDVFLKSDLSKLAGQPRHPIVIISEGDQEQEEALRKTVDREHPDVAPFVIVHAFSPYQVDILIRSGLMGTVYGPNDLRSAHFNSSRQMIRQSLYQVLEGNENAWRKRLEAAGMILRPLFYKKNGAREDVLALAKGYVPALQGKSYTALLSEGDMSLSANEKADFKRAVKSHAVIGGHYEGYKSLGVFEDQEGLFQVAIPPGLISMLQRLKGNVPLSINQLSNRFLFDASDIKPAEVVRQIITFLESLGYVTPEGGDKYRLVAKQSLKNKVTTAQSWLEGPYKQGVKTIQKLSEPLATDLLKIRLVEAKNLIKQAGIEAEKIDLAYINWDWSRLQVKDDNNVAAYEAPFKLTTGILANVKDATQQVFETEPDRAFVYNNDLLTGFDNENQEAGYPLWKRFRILQGFCQFVMDKRKELNQIIDDQLNENEVQIADGPDGQKIFPTQVLNIPLRQWKQEVNFPAQSPFALSAGGSSTLPHSLGFKISQGKYDEARKRVKEIEDHIQNIISRYVNCRNDWNRLVQQLAEIQEIYQKWEKFFDDAGDKTRKQFRLGSIANELDRIRELVLGGGIRMGTDEREAAMASTEELIRGLEEDIRQLKGEPQPIEDDLANMSASVLQFLDRLFREQNAVLFSAANRVCQVRKRDYLRFPESLQETYGKSEQAFMATINEADDIGKQFFAPMQKVSWRDYQALCEIDLKAEEIPWEQDPYRDYVSELQSFGLLKMKLS
ncbi:MAG: hypothetical protein ACM3PE_01855 [Deltaproteobacteria bacterium]